MTITFADLPLSQKVKDAVAAAGYTEPTPIQESAIPYAVEGRDVLGIAQTGTGKTASFVLPMITRLEMGRARARMPRSLILAPTRELAAQVEQSFEKYGINHKLTVALLIGGVAMDAQIKKLDRGVDVLIATPGRMLDHFQRGRIMLMGVEILVIDEADRMLDMGFIPDIEKICKLLPPKRQTLFFSATMPPEITRLADQFLTDPVRVEVAPPATTARTITQLFRYCPEDTDWAKRQVLRDLIEGETVKNAIIFCNRKRDVAILHKSLTKHGYNSGALHGDMDQKSRMETLDKFRSGDVTYLAASDVAARGLDIPEVSHVFNFDVPWASDDYVHRIGRTGRAGRLGTSLTLVGPDELKFVREIEKMTGEPVQWTGTPPTDDDFTASAKGRRRRGAKTARPQGGREERSDRPQGAGRNRDASRKPRREPAAIPGMGEQPVLADAPRAFEKPADRPARATGQPDRRNEKPQGQGRDTQKHRAPVRKDEPIRADSAPQQAAPQPRRQGGTAGFAGHIPAFLQRPTKRAKPAAVKNSEETA